MVTSLNVVLRYILLAFVLHSVTYLKEVRENNSS